MAASLTNKFAAMMRSSKPQQREALATLGSPREAIMRWIYVPLIIAVVGFDVAAKAETDAVCPSSLSSEASGTDKEQMELLAKQATTCVREGKLALAVVASSCFQCAPAMTPLSQ